MQGHPHDADALVVFAAAVGGGCLATIFPRMICSDGKMVIFVAADDAETGVLDSCLFQVSNDPLLEAVTGTPFFVSVWRQQTPLCDHFCRK